MAAPVAPELVDQPPAPPERPRRRRRLRLVLVALAVLVALVVVAALVLLLGRERATELSADDALSGFRSGAGGATAGTEGDDGRPAAGVYDATASGTESIGLPGFDEQLGPSAPVTVTHGGDGCFTYRADLNSHHWRSWTFCPTDGATASLTRLDAWTARKAPGLDIATTTTYTCQEPLDVLWPGAEAGERRSGACTGTSDMDDSLTTDEGTAEVLGEDVVEVGGERVDAVRVRTTDTFGGDQTGTEVGEWWLDAATGLPLRVSIDARLEGGLSSYSERFELSLTTLSPAT